MDPVHTATLLSVSATKRTYKLTELNWTEICHIVSGALLEGTFNALINEAIMVTATNVMQNSLSPTVVAVTDASTHFACPGMDGQAELGQVAWMNN